jgi:hypothetical protein
VSAKNGRGPVFVPNGDAFELEHRDASSTRAPIDAALAQDERIVPSDLEMRAHLQEETPAAPIEDREQIRAILGL